MEGNANKEENGEIREEKQEKKEAEMVKGLREAKEKVEMELK